MINEGWALLCEIGFWGWVLSVIGLIVRSIDGKPFQRGTAMLWWGSLAVLSYGFWVYGMIKA